MKTKYIIKAKEFVGLPNSDNFKLIEEEIDENLKEGEILTQALVVSVDPFIRAHAFPVKSTVIGFQASRVLKSTVDEYPKGCVVMFHGGWKTVCKVKKDEIWYRVDQLLSEENLTKAVGVLGMPGLTAYVGFLDLCKPKKGETVMVNACSGAVGGLVGQIAKIKGCRAVGCCGSEEKIAFSKSIGYDDVFNYKTESWPEAIKRVAPNGIDCFFDNVGGQLASDTVAQMNTYGRIAACGAISTYNNTEKAKADVLQMYVVGNQLEMRGFIISDPKFRPRYPAAIKDLAGWLKSGEIKVRETVTNGFENLPQAFISMLTGGNVGKAVVRL